MSRFNKTSVPQVGPRSGLVTTDERIRTHEGALGWKRNAKSELFLLAASFMGGDDNFYEKSTDRYQRLLTLVSEVVQTDLENAGWFHPFIEWLRDTAQMRTVSMVVAIEAVRARLAAGQEGMNRQLVSAACSRADEPAEVLAYYLSEYGKPIPQPIKNGVADAAKRLYNEFSYLKYGRSRSAALSMADVLRLVHVVPKDEKQNALFSYIVGQSAITGPETLPVIYNRDRLYTIPRDQRMVDVDQLNAAGMTWENVSEWYPPGMTGAAWDAMIPNMGVMALIRNLRNFDEKGISQESARLVESRIRNPDVVRKSRQLPFRWYNAYRSVESVRWSTALDEALTYSLVNIPKLRGKTLVLVDMSGSMFGSVVSSKSNVTYADAAALFGTALKLANPYGVDLYQFGSDFDTLVNRYVSRSGREFGSGNLVWKGCTQEIDLRVGGSVLRGMEKFHDMGGTQIHESVAETVRNEHDRIILLTDEQGWHTNYDDLPIPQGKNLYVWNLGGYQAGTTRTGKYHRHSFGGLNDNAFKLIPILEAGRKASWPWEENGESQSK